MSYHSRKTQLSDKYRRFIKRKTHKIFRQLRTALTHCWVWIITLPAQWRFSGKNHLLICETLKHMPADTAVEQLCTYMLLQCDPESIVLGYAISMFAATDTVTNDDILRAYVTGCLRNDFISVLLELRREITQPPAISFDDVPKPDSPYDAMAKDQALCVSSTELQALANEYHTRVMALITNIHLCDKARDVQILCEIKHYKHALAEREGVSLKQSQYVTSLLQYTEAIRVYYFQISNSFHLYLLTTLINVSFNFAENNRYTFDDERFVNYVRHRPLLLDRMLNVPALLQ